LKNSFKLVLVLLGIIALLIIPLNGCSLIQGLFKNPNYIYEDNAVLVGGDDRPIELHNNPNAVDVSYSALLSFIKEDPTDQLQYIDRGKSSDLIPFVCSDFAEALHNNAEAAGIRAGYVGIDWIEGGLGHAVNVFETTDLGTVYIDCTGQSIYSQLDTADGLTANLSWDKVAYVETGRKYGVLSLDKAESPSYDFYLEFEQKWEDYKTQLAAYNAAVKQYNQDIAGKIFRQGSKELRDIESRDMQLSEHEKALNALADELGTAVFKPLGLVQTVSLHW
jgi:hypothetical protein